MDDLESMGYRVLHIRDPSIRTIRFPDKADLPRFLTKGMDQERGARDTYNRDKRNYPSVGGTN